MVGSERLRQFSGRILPIRKRSGTRNLRPAGRGQTHPRRVQAESLLALCVRAQSSPRYQSARTSDMSKRQRLSLNFFVYPDGHHEAAWRHKASAADRILDVTYYQELAQRAEAHKFDAVFFADGPVLADNVRYAQRLRLEPITLLTAIASSTTRIGLIATASTTYTEPYNLARLFASLDHLSHGRAGWNIVTTSAPQAAQNFGLPEHPPHGERYEKGREFLDVVTRVWDSWEDDAVVIDPISGIFADADKIHAIDHVGKHFR